MGYRFKSESDQKRNRSQFYIVKPLKKRVEPKKVHQKIEIAFNFIWEITLKCIRTKKNYSWNYVWKIDPRIMSWGPFLKRFTLEGVFEFFHSDPLVNQSLKPTRYLCRHIIYIYIHIYIRTMFNISWNEKEMKDTFDDHSPSHPSVQPAQPGLSPSPYVSTGPRKDTVR